MNRLGMLVDISHVSPETMNAVLATTRAPVMLSHSSARCITEHPRNVFEGYSCGPMHIEWAENRTLQVTYPTSCHITKFNNE